VKTDTTASTVTRATTTTVAPTTTTTVTHATTTTTPPPSLPASNATVGSDEQAARRAIIQAFVDWGSVGTVAQAEAKFGLIDDTRGIRQAAEQAVRNYPYEVSHDVYRVSEVGFVNAATALVVYDIVIDGVPRFTGRVGHAVLVDGTWKITRATVCNDLALAGASCPP
jgi:hypothetical protein